MRLFSGRQAPLRNIDDVRSALRLLDRFDESQWPRIVGAAVGYGLMTRWEGVSLLARTGLPWLCTHCGSDVQITCLDCGDDACAKCWVCTRQSCVAAGKPVPEIDGNGYTRGHVAQGAEFTIAPGTLTLTLGPESVDIERIQVWDSPGDDVTEES